MIKALIIGCGNIGALYDLESEAVSTYAKAFHRDGEITFSVYDADLSVAQRVARRYDVPCLSRWDEVHPSEYDIVVVSSPTPTHHGYLESLFESRPRLVICEKPVDIDLGRLNRLEERYRESGMRVMVNFHRRFQPRMAELRDRVQSLAAQSTCRQVTVTYQRGFHNNASHAMDLLGFLFGTPFSVTDFRATQAVCDEFPADPTVTAHCRWGDTAVQFVGLAGVQFSHFELNLYFPTHAISLRRGGDEVEFFSTRPRRGSFHPALKSDEVWTGALKNHMLTVVAHARRMLQDTETRDNFLESVSISRTIVQNTAQFHL
jgi:predicted dehydrogenase